MATDDTTAQGADPGRPVTTRQLAIVGSGEHAKVVVEAARSTADGWVVIGSIGPGQDPTDVAPEIVDLPYLGDDRSTADRMARLPRSERPWLILGIGLAVDPATRETIVGRHADWGGWATIIHPSASVSPSAVISPGAVVLAGAVIGPGAWIGEHAVVNSAAVIEHDVRVGPFALVGPGAVIGGAARIGRGALIGLGARIRDHISIGDGAVVGMGAVAVRDVPADSRVVGVPARPMVSRDG
jgi:sugar O-acyltransferase (sialic acid O-acetyltransferase NeuD family)